MYRIKYKLRYKGRYRVAEELTILNGQAVGYGSLEVIRQRLESFHNTKVFMELLEE
jgi:hypothetical protein